MANYRRAVAFPGFGPLNLRLDSHKLAWAGAADILNLDLDRPGQLRTRDGTITLVDDIAGTVYGLAAFQSGTALGTGSQFVVLRLDSGTAKLDAYNLSDDSLEATASYSSTIGNMSAVQFGTDSGSNLYIAANLGDIVKWDGSAFTTMSAMPAATFVALWPRSNRLVVGNESTLSFSDAGDAETFSDNTVEVTPGDGSDLTGLVTWQNTMFAFKQNRHFVFTSEAEEEDGTPIFNYYTVDGYGSAIEPVAGNEGVYFYHDGAIWVTTGDTPKLISTDIAPFLSGNVALNGVSSIRPIPTLSYSRGRLYATFTAEGLDVLALVYDPHSGWLIFEFYGALLLPVVFTPISDGGFVTTLLASYDSTNDASRVASVEPSATDDDGTTISWRYKTGSIAPGGDKRISLVESSVWGTGTATVQILTEGARSSDVADSGSAVTLGSSSVAEGIRNKTVRGVWFATKLSGTGQATITGVTHRFRGAEAQE